MSNALVSESIISIIFGQIIPICSVCQASCFRIDLLIQEQRTPESRKILRVTPDHPPLVPVMKPALENPPIDSLSNIERQFEEWDFHAISLDS